MSGYSVKRADLVIPGCGGWAVVDSNGVPAQCNADGSIVSHLKYMDAHAIAGNFNQPAPKVRKRRTRTAQDQRVADRIDGYDRDNLGESFD